MHHTTVSPTRIPHGAVAGAGRTTSSGWGRRHPVASFFVLAYLLSWVAWLPRVLGGQGWFGQVSLLLGGFGPAAAAATLTWHGGGSVRSWARRLLRWRVHPGWYVVALGVPILLNAAVTGELALLGQPVELGLLSERLALFVPLLLYVGLLLGGNEERGCWRRSWSWA